MLESVCDDSFDNFPKTTQEGYWVVSRWIGVVWLARFLEDDCPRHLQSGGEERGEQTQVCEVADGLAQAWATSLDGLIWDLVPARGFVW